MDLEHTPCYKISYTYTLALVLVFVIFCHLCLVDHDILNLVQENFSGVSIRTTHTLPVTRLLPENEIPKFYILSGKKYPNILDLCQSANFAEKWGNSIHGGDNKFLQTMKNHPWRTRYIDEAKIIIIPAIFSLALDAIERRDSYLKSLNLDCQGKHGNYPLKLIQKIFQNLKNGGGVIFYAFTFFCWTT